MSKIESEVTISFPEKEEVYDNQRNPDSPCIEEKEHVNVDNSGNLSLKGFKRFFTCLIRYFKRRPHAPKVIVPSFQTGTRKGLFGQSVPVYTSIRVYK